MNAVSERLNDRDPRLSRQRWRIIAGNMLVFGLIGPIAAYGIWRLNPYGPANSVQYDGLYTITGDIISIAVLCPAFLIIGGIVGLYEYRKGRPPLWLAACPVVVFFGAILLYDLVVPPPPDVTPGLLVLPALSGVLATLLCGVIAGRLWQVKI